MHKSYIFLYTLLSFAAGVGARSFWEVSDVLVYGAAAISCFLIVLSFLSHADGALPTKRKQIVGVVGLSLFAFTFGMARFSWHEAAQTDATILQYVNGGEIAVHGVVVDDPDVREKNMRLTLKVSDGMVDSVSHVADGRILIFAGRYPVFSYGDEVVATGILQKPESFSGFDYVAHLAKDQIYAVMYYPDVGLVSSGGGDSIHRTLFRMKHAFERMLERIVSEPHAAFLKGIILGSRASMPEWLLETFRSAGVIHIIALSGFNITIIADNLTRMLRSITIGPRWSFWISLLAIIFFTIMTGASPSIVRSALMGALILLARREGRMYVGANALVFAGACMILYNPAVLRFDRAFQLSFLATAGLLFIAPHVERHLRRVPTTFALRGNLASTIAAQIAVLPLLLFYFGMFSFVSIPANLLILIAIPYAMFFGFIAGGLGFINIPLGIGVGSVAYIFSFYVISVSSFFAHVPFVNWDTGSISLWLVVALMVSVWGVVLWRGRGTANKQERT